jgi:hypothetical protein
LLLGLEISELGGKDREEGVNDKSERKLGLVFLYREKSRSDLGIIKISSAGQIQGFDPQS